MSSAKIAAILSGGGDELINATDKVPLNKVPNEPSRSWNEYSSGKTFVEILYTMRIQDLKL